MGSLKRSVRVVAVVTGSNFYTQPQGPPVFLSWGELAPGFWLNSLSKHAIDWMEKWTGFLLPEGGQFRKQEHRGDRKEQRAPLPLKDIRLWEITVVFFHTLFSFSNLKERTCLFWMSLGTTHIMTPAEVDGVITKPKCHTSRTLVFSYSHLALMTVVGHDVN